MAKKNTTKTTTPKTKPSTAKKEATAPKNKVAKKPIVREEFSTDEILAEIKEDVTAEEIVGTTDAVEPSTNETEETTTSDYYHVVDPEQDKKDYEARINGTITTAGYDPETGEGESHTYKYDKKEENWVDTESGEKMFEHPENFAAIDATTMEGMEQREVAEDIGAPEEAPKAEKPKKTNSIKVGDGKSVIRKRRNTIKLSTSQMHGHLIYNNGNFDY